MKTYIYSVQTKSTKYGYMATNKVYRVKNNIPYFIGVCTFDSQSCKGVNSEVFTFLYNQKEITKAEYNRFDGYYAGKDARIMEV